MRRIILVAGWVLGLQLVHGGPHLVTPMPDESSCVAAGKRLSAEAARQARAAGKRPAPGWICVENPDPPQPIT